MRIPFLRRPRVARVAIGALLCSGTAACSDPLALTASFETIESTLQVHALNGSNLAYPAAVLIAPTPLAVRPANDYAFDFAVDFDASGTALFYPVDKVAQLGAIASARNVGVQKVTGTAFADLARAPGSGYVYSEVTPIAVGDILVVQSNVHPFCTGNYLSTTIFAKVGVVAIDPLARTAQVLVRTDPNCGFRGLESGLPSR